MATATMLPDNTAIDRGGGGVRTFSTAVSEAAVLDHHAVNSSMICLSRAACCERLLRRAEARSAAQISGSRVMLWDGFCTTAAPVRSARSEVWRPPCTAGSRRPD
jgi:hypothetical protein